MYSSARKLVTGISGGVSTRIGGGSGIPVVAVYSSYDFTNPFMT